MTFSRDEVIEHAELLEDLAAHHEPITHEVITRALKRSAEMLKELSSRRGPKIDPQPGRCPSALHFEHDGARWATRCKKNLSGHGGTHFGRGVDEFPLLEWTWFEDSPMAFQTGRNDFYAWREDGT